MVACPTGEHFRHKMKDGVKCIIKLWNVCIVMGKRNASWWKESQHKSHHESDNGKQFVLPMEQNGMRGSYSN